MKIETLVYFVFSVMLFGCGDNNSKTSTPPPIKNTLTTIAIEDESIANPKDIETTKKFLADMPQPACAGTSASVMSEGTVRIHIFCSGNGKETDGIMTIKNGIVTNIR
jgi:hypothetical protein